MDMEENDIILEEWSPVCDIQAFVEKSDTCYYFYLWINPATDHMEMKSCWICNAATAPDELDVESMEQGQAPAMPKEYILHGINGIKLDGDRLHIVWFEEGNAAALLAGGEIICVIPAWSGYNGFYGYSKYAKGTAPYAWGLADALEVIGERVERSRVFWEQFEQGYWEEVQKQHMASLEKFYGEYEKYYAIDGGKFPPKALVRGSKDGVIYGITAGVSLIPMPHVEEYFGEEFREYRRMELGFATIEKYEGLCELMYSFLSSLAAFPWKEDTFLAHGHTIPLQSIKGYEAVLFINPGMVSDMEMPKYEECMGERINLLWVVPITGKEYQFVKEHEMEETLGHVYGDAAKIHIFDGRCKFVA